MNSYFIISNFINNKIWNYYQCPGDESVPECYLLRMKVNMSGTYCPKGVSMHPNSYEDRKKII